MRPVYPGCRNRQIPKGNKHDGKDSQRRNIATRRTASLQVYYPNPADCDMWCLGEKPSVALPIGPRV